MYYDENVSQYWKHELKPDQNLEDFCSAVLNTLKYWVAMHTNPKVWVENWLSGYEPLEYANIIGEMHNGYFNVKLHDGILEQWCKQHIDDFLLCGECGALYESDYEPFCECEDDCDHDHDEDETPDIDDLIRYMKDIYYDSLPNDVTDQMVYDAMLDSFMTILNLYSAVH